MEKLPKITVAETVRNHSGSSCHEPQNLINSRSLTPSGQTVLTSLKTRARGSTRSKTFVDKKHGKDKRKTVNRQMALKSTRKLLSEIN